MSRTLKSKYWHESFQWDESIRKKLNFDDEQYGNKCSSSNQDQVIPSTNEDRMEISPQKETRRSDTNNDVGYTNRI